MKYALTITAFLFATSANAFIPAHEQDGYRDTGCDPDQQVQITNAAGEYLYSNNPTCPDVGGSASYQAFIDALAPTPDEEEEEEEPVGCKSCAPVTE